MQSRNVSMDDDEDGCPVCCDCVLVDDDDNDDYGPVTRKRCIKLQVDDDDDPDTCPVLMEDEEEEEDFSRYARPYEEDPVDDVESCDGIACDEDPVDDDESCDGRACDEDPEDGEVVEEQEVEQEEEKEQKQEEEEKEVDQMPVKEVTLDSIIELVNADGSFPVESLSACHLNPDVVFQAVPKVDGCLCTKEMQQIIWPTLVVVDYIRKHFAKEEVEWKLILSKSEKFASKKLGASLFENWKESANTFINNH